MTDLANSTILEEAKPKTCNRCGETKLKSDFHQNHGKCKACFNKMCAARKRKRLSDPVERERHNTSERNGRTKRLAENFEYHRARENENAARSRARHALAHPKPPKPLTLRQISQSKGVDKFMPDKPCNMGHLDFRSTSTGQCMTCARDRANATRAENTELFRQKERERYAANPEPIRARKKRYDDLNRDKVNEKARARVGEKTREACREYYAKNKKERSEYRKANRGRYAMHANNRREKIQRVTPVWVDMDAIAEIYEEAARISDSTGIQHDVDHYYPIQGKTCSGLHVANNLRIIPHLENLSKSNRMPNERDGPPPEWPRPSE